MAYISLRIVAAALISVAVLKTEAQQCTIPTSIHATWIDRLDGFRNTWTSTIDATGTTWKKVPPTLFSPRLNCESTSGTVATSFYFVTKVFNVKDCNEIKLRGNMLLMRYKAVPQGEQHTASNCSYIIPTNGEYLLRVKYPIDQAGVQCPFNDGSYQVTYSQSSSVKDQCSGDAESTAEVSGSQLNINSCYSGPAAYDKPYKVNFTCMGTVAGADIDSDANGKGLLLSYTANDGTTMFYCARYKTDGSAFNMSLNVFDWERWGCPIGADYNKFEDSSSSKFRAFTFTDMITTTAAPTSTKVPKTTTAAPATTTREAPKTTTAAPPPTTTTTEVPKTTTTAPPPTTTEVPRTTTASATTKAHSTTTTTTTTTQMPVTTSVKVSTKILTTSRAAAISTSVPIRTTKLPVTTAPITTTKAPTISQVPIMTTKVMSVPTMLTKAKDARSSRAPVPSQTTIDGPGGTTEAGNNICSMVKPCQNGALCKPTGKDTYFCSCTDAFKGKNCTTPVDRKTSGLSADEIRIIMAMVILLAAIIVAVVVVSLVVCHFRQRVNKIPEKGRHLISPDETGYSVAGSKSWYPDYVRS